MDEDDLLAFGDLLRPVWLVLPSATVDAEVFFSLLPLRGFILLLPGPGVLPAEVVNCTDVDLALRLELPPDPDLPRFLL